MVRQVQQFTSAIAHQSRGFGAVFLGVGNGPDHVLGVAAAGNADDQIALMELGPQGHHEDLVIADIIGNGHHQRRIVVEALKVILDLLIQTDTLHEVTDKVRCGGSAAAVAADEDPLAVQPGLLHHVHESIDCLLV